MLVICAINGKAPPAIRTSLGIMGLDHSFERGITAAISTRNTSRFVRFFLAA
jgi:hypothetical protein